MSAIFTASFLAVLRIALVCAAGTLLARRGLMDAAFRRALSRLVVAFLLPCFLIAKLSVCTDVSSLLQWGTIPLVAFAYVAIGILIARLFVHLLRVPQELRRPAVAATAFGNSGYIPIPLVVTVAAMAPLFSADPGAADRGVAYVSVYLAGFSPCLWGIAYPYLAGERSAGPWYRRVLSPPVVSALCGIGLGGIPWFRTLAVVPGAPLRVLLDTAELVGHAAVPCGLLILGANLADRERRGKTEVGRVLAAVCLGRFCVLPVAGCLITFGLLRFGALPDDPMCAFVLMLEAVVPPATNLIVMCQVHHRGEKEMASVLVGSYLVAVPALTLFVAFFLWVAGNV